MDGIGMDGKAHLVRHDNSSSFIMTHPVVPREAQHVDAQHITDFERSIDVRNDPDCWGRLGERWGEVHVHVHGDSLQRACRSHHVDLEYYEQRGS